MENLASVSSPEEAIALRRRAALCEDAGVAARNLSALGSWEQKQGNRELALTFFEQALAKEQAASGEAHPRFAVRLNDLALLLDPARAEPLLRRALAIQESALGNSHPEVAVTLNNLANVLLAKAQPAEAERAARRSLAILEQGLGASHPRVATAVSNLADILQARNDLTGARLLYERALRIDEKAYGLSHPEVAVDLENLASLLDRLGRKEEASRHRARAARIKASGR
jgi:tetratricopeptide (TPR) repeat protein